MNQFDPSPTVANFCKRMQTVVLPLEELEVNKSFSLPKEELSMSIVEDFLEDASKNKRVFVAVEHELCFEISRLPDGTSRRLFYKQARQSSGHSDKDCASEVLRIAKEYTTAQYDELKNYKAGSEDMHAASVISYSYLHKRLSAITVFRNAEEGGTTAIKQAIQTLIKNGNICEISSKDASEIYNSSAALYKIVRIE